MLSRAHLAELYRNTGGLVLRRCRLILGDTAEAEDAMQEVYVRLLRYGGPNPSADGGTVPLAYLYRTAERCCFDRLGRRRREPVGDDTDVAAAPLLDGLPSAAHRLEAARQVERFFRRLDPDLQQLALLHYVDGLTQDAIAGALEVSRRTVGKKLKRLHQRAAQLAVRSAEVRS